MASTAVRVALRVRPLSHKERLSNCTECVSFIPNQSQILIGKDHSFTYDYVYDTLTEQQWIYNTSVVPLVEKFVDGFNATILAYGQTGSGKTFSMGTALEENLESDQKGIVPRFVQDLFNRLENKKNEHTVLVSFLELYNEELVDLLNPQSKKKCEVQIREDTNGNIYWAGIREEICQTPDELVKHLVKGSLSRTTGSTDMNSVSSRSHAIFSVILKQKIRQENDEQSITSKFHFVDLAGSERLKRTNASGDRAREGISINAGLLALGNVISALGDESRRSAHVPYRDSKLTRLLQDSLGGNSQTLMMACVSPSDTNFAETLSTLKYANRARNIKNKVSVNQEFVGSSVQVNQLRSQVARLNLELQALKSKSSPVGGLGNDEITKLKNSVQSLESNLWQVTAERDSLKLKLNISDCDLDISPLIGQYQQTITHLRQELSSTQNRLALSESVRAPLVQAMATISSHPSHNSTTTKKRANHAKKRRVLHGSTTTTAKKNISFKSAKRHKQPLVLQEENDIDQWLQETLGSIQTSESSGLRIDAKQSISVAKNQIDKAMKVLDDFKTKGLEEKSEYECELLADNELFTQLQSYENLFADLQDMSSEESNTRRSRTVSAETIMTDDTDFSEINPNFNRVLDQIQSDIQVNECLVNQLEKTELEYLEMRKQFEAKIYTLRDQIVHLQESSPQNMHDIKQAYETKMKTLINQLSDLKRKYSQTTSTIQSSRNQNETMLRALRVNVETLKVEKKRMVKRMKEEAERVKERFSQHEREIQQLKRKQQKDMEIKRKLEKEAKQLQLILQKKTDESLVTAEKMKSLAHILKKAMREGGVVDEKLMANSGSFLDIGAPRKIRRKASLPLQLRVLQKKVLLDQALNQYILSKQNSEELRRLESKRSELMHKKDEYISEREHLLHEEDKNMIPIDRAFRKVIDENIETVEAEISYICERIQVLNNHDTLQDLLDIPTKPVEKRVTFAKQHDDNDWQDVDTPEDKLVLAVDASPEQCIEMIGKMLRTMEVDELVTVMEAAVYDIVALRIEETQNKLQLQQYEKNTEDLHRTLVLMKNTALDAADDYERRLKQFQSRRGLSVRSSFSKLQLSAEDSSDADSGIDILPEDHYQHVETLFHKIYSEGTIDFRRPSTPSTIAEAELSPFLNQRRSSIQKTKAGGAPMKPSASPLAGRRGSSSSPEQFLQQLLMPSERRHSIQSELNTTYDTPPKLVETDSQTQRRRALSFQLPPKAPSPIAQRRHSLLREITKEREIEEHFAKKRSPTSSYELRKSAVANSVFDRLSGAHTRASQAKKRLNSPRYRYSTGNIDELRRQWALEFESINQ